MTGRSIYAMLGFLFSLPAGATWTMIASMDGERSSRNSGLVTRDGNMVFATGVINGPCVAAVYSPREQTWVRTGQMPGCHIENPAVLLGEKVLSVGNDGSAYVLDTISLQWSTAESARYQHYRGALVALNDQYALLVGDQFIGDASQCELFSARDAWSSCGTLSVPRSYATATRMLDGRVLVAGGQDTNTAEIYDPLTNTWSMTGAMRSIRSRHAATLLHDGRVLVVGGREACATPAEIFDTKTGAWSPTSSPASWCFFEGHALVTMEDGNVLLADYSYSTIFDPLSESWSYSGPMNVPRSFALAVNLPGEGVLFAGGTRGESCWNEYCYPLYTLTAEVFTR